MIAAVLAARDVHGAATIDYVALAPMLIVFGAACSACSSRRSRRARARYAAQVGAHRCVGPGRRVRRAVVAGQPRPPGPTARAVGAVVIDGPTLFLQGAVLVLRPAGVLTLAERLGGVGGDAFTPQGAATPGLAAGGAPRRRRR